MKKGLAVLLLFSCSVTSDSVTPWTTALQASLSVTISQSLLKLMSTESVMLSNHLILCGPLLRLPSILPSNRVFSNESAFRVTWPKYWSFSFSIGPSSEYSGLISFRTDWFDQISCLCPLPSSWSWTTSSTYFISSPYPLKFSTFFGHKINEILAQKKKNWVLWLLWSPEAKLSWILHWILYLTNENVLRWLHNTFPQHLQQHSIPKVASLSSLNLAVEGEETHNGLKRCSWSIRGIMLSTIFPIFALSSNSPFPNIPQAFSKTLHHSSAHS